MAEKKKAAWTYSEVPKRQWHWDIVEDHWIDLTVYENGLSYIGTDWTCQSGGGYMAGFQSFTKFMEEGGIAEMPGNIEKEVRDHLMEYRREGALEYIVIHRNLASGYSLFGLYVHLDDKPIIIKKEEELGKNLEYLIFRGTLPVGEHIFGWTVTFLDGNGVNGRQNSARGEFSLDVPGSDDNLKGRPLKIGINLVTEMIDGKLATRGEFEQ